MVAVPVVVIGNQILILILELFLLDRLTRQWHEKYVFFYPLFFVWRK